MAAEIHRLRDKAGETEKITINLGYVDLGHIDLLVQEGFYSNRTDFIRTAIRNQLSTHGEEVRKSIVRHTLELGLRHYTSADLEAVEAAGEKLHIKVLGLASIAPRCCLASSRKTSQRLKPSTFSIVPVPVLSWPKCQQTRSRPTRNWMPLLRRLSRK